MSRRPLTAEDLFQFRLPGDAQVSPDGSRIAYVETQARKEKNDYTSRIMLLVPGKQAVPLTSGEKDANPRWSPDGQYLSFSRNGQVWLLPATGGEAWQLTKQKGCGGPAFWSPDSKKIALSVMLGSDGLQPEKESEEQDLFAKFTSGVKVITDLHYKADGAGFPGDKKPQVVIVDVESGEALQLTSEFAHGNPAWSPCGRFLAFSAKRAPDADDKDLTFLWTLPVEPGSYPAPAEAYKQITPEGIDAFLPKWSPDGRLIAFAGRPVYRHAPPDLQLYVVDAAGGEPRCLTAEHDRPVGNSASVDMAPGGGFETRWSPDGSAIYTLMSDGGAVYLARVDLAGGPITYLTDGDQVVFGGSASADGRRFALAIGRVDDPSQLYLLENGEITQLTRANAELLAEVAIAPVTRFRFRAGDAAAPEIDGWLVEPIDRQPGRRYPAVLEIHGGPAMMYPSAFLHEFQYLASRGFAVLYTNPRGGLGYGKEFAGALSNARWGTVDYDDLMAGVDAALARFDWIDPERLGVGGGSYGGYMTNWIVGHTNRFKAAVTMRSISNWFTMWGTSDISYTMIDEWGAPWEDETPWRRISPITYVTQIQTPLLIEHQEEDHRCPVEQGEQLYVALRKLRRPVKFVRYPGESHGMSRGGKPWHRVHRLITLGDWFAQYLGEMPQA